MRVALVHDWLTGMRGGERVLEELCELFPDASLFTLLHKPGSVSPRIESMPIRVSFLNRIPGVWRHYPHLLPLFPFAVSRFDLRGFDLILSVSHAAAKGIRKPPGSLHICYCLTPMRYLYDMKGDYFQYADTFHIRRAALQAALLPLRRWDRTTARGVDHFIADSRHVKDRISKYYQRESEVIYPPVDTDFFIPSSDGDSAGFYLVATALVSYKRVDIAIDAFNRLGRPLIVAGDGPDRGRLQAMAAANIQFRGFVTDEELRDLYRHCRAVIITGREDFGLVSLEAQACGRPPLAYGAGGSLESITDGHTGILFGRQTPEAVIDGVSRLESTGFNPMALRKNAERFSREKFRTALLASITAKCGSINNGIPSHACAAAAAGHHPAARHRSVSGPPGMSKRMVDILFSAAGLLVVGLPVLAVALLIRLSSKGPAFFFQTRLGLQGRKFTMFKLRTMYVDAERDLGPTWAVVNDPRCTRLGGILRRYGIDELPQLYNVLKGDMSLVGPRPERPEFHKVFEAELPEFGRRLEVRGGITGLAQIRGWRGDTSIAGRLKSDLEYVDHWSLWKDLRIILGTLIAMFRTQRQSQDRLEKAWRPEGMEATVTQSKKGSVEGAAQQRPGRRRSQSDPG